MSQSILSIDPAGSRRALVATPRKSIELRVSFDIAGTDTDDHLLPATRTDSGRPMGVVSRSVCPALTSWSSANFFGTAASPGRRPRRVSPPLLTL